MKTALITGASSGIGWELAKVLAQQNYHLVLVARNTVKLHELKNQLQRKDMNIHVISMDLSKVGAAQELFKETEKLQLSVDLLINNAGFGEFGDFSQISLPRQSEMIQLNITALTELSHVYLQGMLKRQSGHIINIASTAAFQPGPGMAVYFATKAYVLSFSEALSEELCGKGVHVTAICPGPTQSGFQEAANLNTSKLFERMAVPTSEAVAHFTWHAIQKKQVVAVHGAMNRFLIFLNKLTPRSIVRKVAGWIMQKKNT